MKKGFTILILLLFALSSIVMPYANFNDTKALTVLYNNCLFQDADLTFIEFIGEKLLLAAFPEDEDEPLSPIQKSTQQVIHIQNSGVLYQPKTQSFICIVPSNILFNLPIEDTRFIYQNFELGIFHPPCFA